LTKPIALPGTQRAIVPYELPGDFHGIARQHFAHAGDALLGGKWRVGAAHVGFHPAWVKKHDADAARL